MKLRTKKDKLVRNCFIIRKRKSGKSKGFSVEIGGSDAWLNDDMLKIKGLKEALWDVGEILMEQLNCDGICFNSLGFQRWWDNNKKKKQ